jgi:hypothetical protein
MWINKYGVAFSFNIYQPAVDALAANGQALATVRVGPIECTHILIKFGKISLI